MRVPKPLPAGLPIKEAYARHLGQVRNRLRDVEHYRAIYTPKYEGKNCKSPNPQTKHVAVVVLLDGTAFVGEARVNYQDSYSRKRGHEVSMGRALKKAANHPWNGDGADFAVPRELDGVELRDHCRKVLVERGVL